MSVDTVAENRKVVDKLELDFPVLSDQGGRVIRSWGVAHIGGGMGGVDIARPATFVVTGDGRVAWRDLTDNWRVRVRPEEVLEAISRLQPQLASRPED